jgi:hypothetical protein
VIQALAVAAVCGIPAQRITDGDEVERELWLAATARAADLRLQLMKAEAGHIANAVGRLFSRA